jgi:exopolysaccharide production protein ExoQ
MRRTVYWLSLAFIFMIPWEGVIRIPGLGTGAKVIGLAAGGCWLALITMTGRVRTPDPFLVLTTVFVVWVGASVWWSTDTLESARHVVTWVQSLALVYVIWDIFRTRPAIHAALQAYVLGVYVAVIGALMNYSASEAFYTNYERYSPGDTNPDGFGFLIALGIPVAFYLAGRPAAGRLSGLRRLVNYGFIPLAFFGLALSGTRTAAIAAGLGTIFGIASLTRLRPFTRLAVILVLGIALYTLAPVISPLESFQRLGTTGTEVTQGDLNGRILQWSQGLVSFEDHPVLGIGTNRYRSVNTLGKEAHNSYVSVLVELGLVGLALFAAVIGMALARALATHGWDRYFWLTILGVWAIGASTLTWEHRKSTWLFLSLMVAAGAEAQAQAQAQARARARARAGTAAFASKGAPSPSPRGPALPGVAIEGPQ